MRNPCQYIDEYLDGSLESYQVSDFESHLKNCSACQLEVEIAAGVHEQLQKVWLPIKASEHLRQAVSTQLNSTHKRSRNNDRLVVQVLSLVATVIALAAISIWYLDAIANRNTRVSSIADESNADEIVEPAFGVNDALEIVRFESNAETILVPVPCTSTNFTIVTAYPTLPLTEPHYPELENNEDEKAN